MLAILGICIEIEILTVGMHSMWIPISRWRIVDLGTKSWIIVTGWGWGRSGRGGIRSGVRYLCWIGGGAPVPLCFQRFCRFFAVSYWKGRQPPMWISCTIAGCPCIAAFMFQCPGNWTPRIVSSRTLPRGLLVRYWLSSIVAHENPPLAILAIFQERHMPDCSSCSLPPCRAIVVD